MQFPRCARDDDLNAINKRAARLVKILPLANYVQAAPPFLFLGHIVIPRSAATRDPFAQAQPTSSRAKRGIRLLFLTSSSREAQRRGTPLLKHNPRHPERSEEAPFKCSILQVAIFMLHFILHFSFHFALFILNLFGK
jgi:hypothetical protein